MSDATPGGALSDEEQGRLHQFFDENRLFYGPDPEIMRDHRFGSRTAEEERILASSPDPHEIHRIRNRLLAALDETYLMVEQMGAAPGAKWGDLVTAIFTPAGDLSLIGRLGVLPFAGICHYPVKFVLKYWMDEPTVGVRDGDGFIHNDSRYGQIHNTDQSVIMPLFWKGELVCWLASIIHEGENGACEPGGMPAGAETRFDEGLKMSPFKIVEDFKIRRDVLNFLQNSVRDPKLQYEDLKVKLHATLRLRERVISVLEEHGRDMLWATLRRNLEDTDAEARRRIQALPDGKTRTACWVDSTLRENVLIKMAMEVTVEGDQLTFDLRGTAPQFTNRSLNTRLSSAKIALLTGILQNFWPDLLHNMAVFQPFEVATDPNSVVDCGDEAPNAMSLIPLFRLCTMQAIPLAKLAFSVPDHCTAIVAAPYNQPATLIYGGLTQHYEVTGNFCADINGNGQGARFNRDGEHAVSPIFGYMCDTGEQELNEEELPFVRLVAQKLTKDRVGFGKYRGGLGYEQMVAVRGTPMFGFSTGCSGSLHTCTYGLFGGYGSPAYPLGRISGVDIFDVLRDAPDFFEFDILNLLNQREIPGATYFTLDMANPFQLAAEGEIFMMCQGSGAGYGDVLERDPALVAKDLSEGLISRETAFDIYRVVMFPDTFAVDEEATEAARAEERQARLARGVPYRQFVEEWVTEEPPAGIPYYGSWGDDPSIIYTGVGDTRQAYPAGQIPDIFLPDPKDVRLAQLEAELLQLRTAPHERG